MGKMLVAVAALLLFLTTESCVAVAAGVPEHQVNVAGSSFKQKKVDKFLEMLRAIGISDPHITELANEIGKRRMDGYWLLHEEYISGGSLSLRYLTNGKVGIKQLELLYAPEDSYMEYRVNSNAMMANYKINF